MFEKDAGASTNDATSCAGTDTAESVRCKRKESNKQKSRLKLKQAKCLRDEKMPKPDMFEIDADA